MWFFLVTIPGSFDAFAPVFPPTPPPVCGSTGIKQKLYRPQIHFIHLIKAKSEFKKKNHTKTANNTTFSLALISVKLLYIT